jgi:hypothetical protein
MIPMAGLDPAIYAFPMPDDAGFADVGGRNKSGRGEHRLQSWVAGTSPATGTQGCAAAPRNLAWAQGRAKPDSCVAEQAPEATKLARAAIATHPMRNGQIADNIVEILAGLSIGKKLSTGGPLFIDRVAGSD